MGCSFHPVIYVLQMCCQHIERLGKIHLVGKNSVNFIANVSNSYVDE